MSNPAQGADGAGPKTLSDQIADAIERRWCDLVGPALDGGSIGWKRSEFCREFAVTVLERFPALATPRTDSAERTAGEVEAIAYAAYDAGFDASGEGWNGEYPENCNETASYRQKKREYLNGLATPAPSSPGVPDSVREAVADLLQIEGQEEEWRQRGQLSAHFAALNLARHHARTQALDWVLSIISAHPAGQSEDEAERCGICDKPLIAGQRVMQDVELDTVHADCCGPERQAYVKDVESGEPLGPNDPIPQGYIYQPDHPAGQSTGQGADILAATLAEFQRRNGYHRREIEELLTEFGELLLSKVQPAPDSTRTGDEGTEEARLIGPKMTPEQEERIAHNLCGEFGPDAVVASAAFVKAFYAELYAAARPAAPEAQGAWSFDMEAAPRDGTNVIVAVASIHEGHEPIVGQAYIDTDNGGHWWWAGTSYGDYYASPIHETNNPPYAWHPMLPAPPASSGQGGR